MTTSSHPVPHSWRDDAARIVEELFPVTPTAAWDWLLDLRQNLVHGNDWNQTLDLFLACRQKLEEEHYLPFYRLRTLLGGSLRLEANNGGNPVACLHHILRAKHRSLADIRRALSREIFEHSLTPTEALELRVVEA